MLSMRPAALAMLILGILFAKPAMAANSFQQTNLVSDLPNNAKTTDTQLKNPWGVAFLNGGPFWISDNNSGFSSVYDAQGNFQFSVVVAAPPGANSPSTPTGMVANSNSGEFMVTTNGSTHASLFIFDTEDGTISGWNGAGNSTLAVDNSTKGAVYKGLALGTNSSGDFLFATNFNSGRVEVYDSQFRGATLTGNFTDPNLPAGMAPFGIQNIGNNQLVVTYAMQDAPKHDPVKTGGGVVDLFDTSGNFVRRIATGGQLEAPWGVAIAPANFGSFGGQLLVGNFGNGWINVFDLASGNFVDTLKNSGGNVIVIDGLWALVFRSDGVGGPDTLYFTAGTNSEADGTFGTLTATAAVGNAPDFTLMVSPASATITRGGSAMFTISAAAMNGFSGNIQMSCSSPMGTSCSLSPSAITQGQTSTLDVSVASTYMIGRAPGSEAPGLGLMAPFTGIGLVGMVLAGVRGKNGKSWKLVALLLGLIAVGVLLIIGGCGSSSSMKSTMNPSNMANVTVTATSGSVTHSTSVAVTVH
ncbi:MAG: TIGR03118 family protein [Acidobacteria bacterium]|nr:TIGR03118 family protein [Acidobacteriota bacterium]